MLRFFRNVWNLVKIINQLKVVDYSNLKSGGFKISHLKSGTSVTVIGEDVWIYNRGLLWQNSDYIITVAEKDKEITNPSLKTLKFFRDLKNNQSNEVEVKRDELVTHSSVKECGE